METVKSLRQSGYKVKVLHFRITDYSMDRFGLFDPKGGSTVIEITSPEGIQVRAEAKCSSKDNYCRRTGVAICLGRALKELEYQERLQKIKPKKESSLGNFINERFEEIWKEKEVTEINFERPILPTEEANKFPEADSVPLLEQIARDLCKKKIEELDELMKDEQVSKNVQRGLDFFKEVAEVFKDPSFIKDVKREGYFQ
jgi:hypothetical protein